MHGFVDVPGNAALILVAPHGGRRDAVRRPWGSAALKMNDLETVAVTRALAAATGGAALINPTLDRNDVDLNRISAAHDLAPAFLERLAALLRDALRRHERVTVLTIHGWNVIQPVVDLGIGVRSMDEPLDDAAVSPHFAAQALAGLQAACAAHGIEATVGARYPARARENLIQLFTTRYRDDPRPLVRALAQLGARCDAVQLELGVPLRWPGVWRERLIAACATALSGHAVPLPPRSAMASAPPAATRRTLELVDRDLAALLAIDKDGARLLVFPAGGGLVLFTGERTDARDDGRAGGLSTDGDDGDFTVRFHGPMARFADTTPFLDLECGLASSTLIEDAVVQLRFRADGPAMPPHGAFGRVHGSVLLDGHRIAIDGQGCAGRVLPSVWPRLRVALRLDAIRTLALTLGTADGTVEGVVRDDHRDPRPVRAASVRLGPGDDPLGAFTLTVETDDGTRFAVEARAVHRLPVVRGGSHPVRLLYASCRVEGCSPALAGWCELGGY